MTEAEGLILEKLVNALNQNTQAQAELKAEREQRLLSSSPSSQDRELSGLAYKVLGSIIVAAVLTLAAAVVALRDTVNNNAGWIGRAPAEWASKTDLLQADRRLEFYVRQQIREHQQEYHPR